MKSVVELNISAPQAKVAKLFEDPQQFPKWMDDVDRVEPVNGSGRDWESQFRMVPKRGNLIFTAKVVKRTNAHAQLALEAPTVSVSVNGTFMKLSAMKTRLVSEEVFTFKGLFGHLFGWIGFLSIMLAHRRHMRAFKRFAESLHTSPSPEPNAMANVPTRSPMHSLSNVGSATGIDG